MQSTLRVRTQLELLKKLRDKKNPLQKGFTLVELMITVAVIGVLSAVALPQFLQARNAATAGAAVGEVLGLAKECATGQASGVGSEVTPPTGAVVLCDGTADRDLVSTSWVAGPVGVTCLDQKSTKTSTKATVTAKANGELTCAFS
jgi:type IV pilus assembly protein PilA